MIPKNCPVVLLLLLYNDEGEPLHLSHDLFYRSSAESILASSWFDNSAAVQGHNLKGIMRTAEEIIGALLPHLQDIYPELCSHKAGIIKDTFFSSRQVYSLEKYINTKGCSALSHCQSAQNKLKCLSLLIFNCPICLNPVLTYLLI